MVTLYRWRGALLAVACLDGSGGGGSGYELFSLAVSENCCCPPCEYPCCCTENSSGPIEPGNGSGSCLFKVREPYCCQTATCIETIIDDNISGVYYIGGITQLTNFYSKFWSTTPFPTLNNPYNDYYLAAEYTQIMLNTMPYSV